MIASKNDIHDRIVAIQEELDNLHHQADTFDKKKFKSLGFDILDLTSETAIFLEKSQLLSPWSKHHLIGAVNACNWGWLYLASNRIKLAIEDESKISPRNTYDQEITNLKLEELITYVDHLKKSGKQP